MFLKTRFKRGGVFIIHNLVHCRISMRSRPLGLSSFYLKTKTAKNSLQETAAPPTVSGLRFTRISFRMVRSTNTHYFDNGSAFFPISILHCSHFE